MNANEKAVGVVMMIAAGAVIFTMAHHPAGTHGATVLAEIVHGVMIALVAVLLAGFVRFCQIRGLHRLIILLGLVSYGLSFVANVGAATINGFVVGALAAKGDAVSHEIFLLCWETNQALARLGVASTGAALVFWSVDFLKIGNLWNRLVGVLGFVAGIAPLMWFIGVSAEMNVTAAFGIYGAHALWTGLVGLQLYRGVVQPH